MEFAFNKDSLRSRKYETILTEMSEKLKNVDKKQSRVYKYLADRAYRFHVKQRRSSLMLSAARKRLSDKGFRIVQDINKKHYMKSKSKSKGKYRELPTNSNSEKRKSRKPTKKDTKSRKPITKKNPSKYRKLYKKSGYKK